MNRPTQSNQPNTQQPNPDLAQSMLERQKLKPDQFGFFGKVAECLPNTMFRVDIQESDVPELVEQRLLCTLAGKMRLNRIRVMPGDKVLGYITKYDPANGKITFRVK